MQSRHLRFCVLHVQNLHACALACLENDKYSWRYGPNTTTAHMTSKSSQFLVLYGFQAYITISTSNLRPLEILRGCPCKNRLRTWLSNASMSKVNRPFVLANDSIDEDNSQCFSVSRTLISLSSSLPKRDGWCFSSFCIMVPLCLRDLMQSSKHVTQILKRLGFNHNCKEL